MTIELAKKRENFVLEELVGKYALGMGSSSGGGAERRGELRARKERRRFERGGMQLQDAKDSIGKRHWAVSRRIAHILRETKTIASIVCLLRAGEAYLEGKWISKCVLTAASILNELLLDCSGIDLLVENRSAVEALIANPSKELSDYTYLSEL